jgi:hypothetical protein
MIRCARRTSLIALLALTLCVSPAIAGGGAVRPNPQGQRSAWGWLWQQVGHLVSFVGKDGGTMDPNGNSTVLQGSGETPTAPGQSPGATLTLPPLHSLN